MATAHTKAKPSIGKKPKTKKTGSSLVLDVSKKKTNYQAIVEFIKRDFKNAKRAEIPTDLEPMEATLIDDLDNGVDPAIILNGCEDIFDCYDKGKFVSIISSMPVDQFRQFCENIMQYQYFRDKLNNTAGAESLEFIPEELRPDFQEVWYRIEPFIGLQETEANKKHPGIILQKFIRQNGYNQKAFIDMVMQLQAYEFNQFCDGIRGLEWFRSSQSGCLFTFKPEKIPKKWEQNFWFIDDTYLFPEYLKLK